jgi:hypothetical protein
MKVFKKLHFEMIIYGYNKLTSVPTIWVKKSCLGASPHSRPPLHLNKNFRPPVIKPMFACYVGSTVPMVVPPHPLDSTYGVL